MSEANQTINRAVKETVFDQTPVNSPDWQEYAYNSEGFSAEPNVIISNEIRASRMNVDQSLVGVTSQGSLEVEMSDGTFDDFLESVMMDTWTSDVLNIGTTMSSYSIEKEFRDVPNAFYQYSGQRVTQFDLNVATDDFVTATFSFMGASESSSATSAVGTGTSTPASSAPRMSAPQVTGIKVDGVDSNMCISNLSLTLNNNPRDIRCIGKLANSDVKLGTAEVSVSFTAYFDAASKVEYDKVNSQTELSFEFQITDGTNSYTFLLPKCKASAPAPQSTGKDTDVTVDFTLNGFEDAVEGTALRITR